MTQRKRLYDEYYTYTEEGFKVAEDLRAFLHKALGVYAKENFDMADVYSVLVSEVDCYVTMKRISIGMEKRVHDRNKESKTDNSGE